MAERVRIEAYDPIKGKGTYRRKGGELVPFRYGDFHELRAIPPGSDALLRGTTLHPADSVGLWALLVRFFRRLFGKG